MLLKGGSSGARGQGLDGWKRQGRVPCVPGTDRVWRSVASVARNCYIPIMASRCCRVVASPVSCLLGLWWQIEKTPAAQVGVASGRRKRTAVRFRAVVSAVVWGLGLRSCTARRREIVWFSDLERASSLSQSVGWKIPPLWTWTLDLGPGHWTTGTRMHAFLGPRRSRHWTSPS